MFRIKQKGGLTKTKKFLKNASSMKIRDILERYGEMGVDALSSATPINTGETSAAWGYEINRTVKGIEIVWTNSNVVNGVPIALILQYGHATNGGGYVEGLDYINSALRPVFEQLADAAWKEVVSI